MQRQLHNGCVRAQADGGGEAPAVPGLVLQAVATDRQTNGAQAPTG
jgi:hypothetical protein